MYTSHRKDAGTTSRLLCIGEARQEWELPYGGSIPFPLVLDLQQVDEKTRRLDWRFEAYLDLIDGEPKLTAVNIVNPSGIDPAYMQAFFRWQSPLDVVTKMVPELVRIGKDPFNYDFPIDGYPDVANPKRHALTPLSDEFLQEIAEQYRFLGRGYASKIAERRGVSRRTVVSWVEKARKRGILGKTTPGKLGERGEE